MTNPNEDSRAHLYTWMRAHGDDAFTIDDSGDFIAYKRVRQRENNDKEYSSFTSGFAIVDGRETRDVPVRQNDGSVVEMPRSMVEANPSKHCSVGLHVGTWKFAINYCSTIGVVVVEVRINPRDVVSVPNDASGQKMRVCRYRVIGKVDKSHTKTIVPAPKAVPPKASIPATTPATKKGGAKKAKAQGSPLDANKVSAFILSALKKGETNVAIAQKVEAKFGVKTTASSIRRFIQRRYPPPCL